MNLFLQLLDESEITAAEERMGLRFPSELRNFYLNIGYGFLGSRSGATDRIMHPGSVADFRLHAGAYQHFPQMKTYDKYTRERLIFFQVTEREFFSIQLTTKYTQKIYLLDKVVAYSFEEFLMTYPYRRFTFTGRPASQCRPTMTS